MSPSELAQLLQARPFSPLLLLMSDGKSFQISRPGMAIVTPKLVIIGIPGANGSRLAKRIVQCPIDDIVSVQRAEASI